MWAEAEIFLGQRSLYLNGVFKYCNLGTLLGVVKKDYDGAEQEYRTAIRLAPQDAVAHCSLGNLLGDVEEDYDGAEQEYRTAIRLEPELELAHINLGALLEDGANMNRTHTFDGGL